MEPSAHSGTVPEGADLRRLLQQALQLHQSGDLTAAIPLYRRALELQPAHADALHLLGAALLSAGNVDGALKLLCRAVAIHPCNATLLNNYGNALFSGGNFEEALEIYRRALTTEPESPDIHYNAANTLMHLGRMREAIAELETALALQPDAYLAHYNLGIAHQELGEPAEAAASYRAALQIHPEFLHARNNLGLVLSQQGKYDEAIAEHQRALQSNPDYAPSHLNLGNAFRQTRRLTEAIAAYEETLRLDPACAEAHYNLGLAFKDHGMGDRAFDSFQRAIDADPQFASAQFELGLLAKQRGDHDRAVEALQKALAGDPKNPEAHYHLGYVFQERAQYGLALAAYEQATASKPDYFEAHFNSAMIADELGLSEEAIRRYGAAVRIRGDDWLANWGKLLTLPPIYDDEAQIDQCRQRWGQGIRCLLEELSTKPHLDASTALRAISWKTNFYLHYQGCDNTGLQRLFGQFISQMAAIAFPDLTRPFARRALVSGEKLRIGFASGFLRHHTISKLFAAWIHEFDRRRFEVHSLDFNGRCDAAIEALKRSSSYHDLSPRQPREIIEHVRGLDLDILVYLDVGMHPKIQPMAALRLAPVQCCTWGHPVTTGLPTMDYFLSSELMEPPNAQEHYSEKLVLLPNLSICYAFPELAAEPSDMAGAGATPLFLCSQSLFKLLPRYDGLYPRIARRLPTARFCFLADKSSLGTEKFCKRITRAFTAEGLNAETHVTVMNRIAEADFFKLNRQATAILDSFWWSGGNTSLEALACNKAIVTSPGPMMRGRHTTGILRRAGLDELIAADTDEYVEIAVRLAQDTAWRIALEEKIRAQKQCVYADASPIRALEDFFCSLFKG